MFNQPIDERLSVWAEHRSLLEICEDPITFVWEFWKSAPFTPYNAKIDPFNPRSWPTPWEIIVENKYDDFTKALMIGQTLKITERFKNTKIELKTLVDTENNRQYNIVCIEDSCVINYSDNGPTLLKNIPESFLLENIIELTVLR